MKSKYRNFVVVAAFMLLAGSFVVIAQDEPNTPSENQKIGDLEQEVTNLQNQIQYLRTNATEQLANEEIAAPRPEYDLGSGPEFDAPAPSSVYSVNPAMQPMSPETGAPPEYGYSPQTPPSPWAVVPPTHVVPTPVTQYVPVQVPVYVETAPCWVDYGPVYDPYFPPAVGLNFWFGGGGNGKHHKHKH